MKIAGLQKLTLLDMPGKLACTVFTAGCDFRCPFCQNASLVVPERMDPNDQEDKILAFLKKRQGVLDGVVVSGGEPLLHPDLGDFLEKVRALGYRIKLDTNGSFPDRLQTLVEAGLVDHVAMDIKNGPSYYETTVGGPVDMQAIERTKEYLLSGPVEYLFRTTVVRGLHTRESIAEAAAWIQGAKQYALQQYRDDGDILQPEGLSAFSPEEMQCFVQAAAQYVPVVQLLGI